MEFDARRAALWAKLHELDAQVQRGLSEPLFVAQAPAPLHVQSGMVHTRAAMSAAMSTARSDASKRVASWLSERLPKAHARAAARGRPSTAARRKAAAAVLVRAARRFLAVRRLARKRGAVAEATAAAEEQNKAAKKLASSLVVARCAAEEAQRADLRESALRAVSAAGPALVGPAAEKVYMSAVAVAHSAPRTFACTTAAGTTALFTLPPVIRLGTGAAPARESAVGSAGPTPPMSPARRRSSTGEASFAAAAAAAAAGGGVVPAPPGRDEYHPTAAISRRSSLSSSSEGGTPSPAPSRSLSRAGSVSWLGADLGGDWAAETRARPSMYEDDDDEDESAEEARVEKRRMTELARLQAATSARRPPPLPSLNLSTVPTHALPPLTFRALGDGRHVGTVADGDDANAPALRVVAARSAVPPHTATGAVPAASSRSRPALGTPNELDRLLNALELHARENLSGGTSGDAVGGGVGGVIAAASAAAAARQLPQPRRIVPSYFPAIAADDDEAFFTDEVLLSPSLRPPEAAAARLAARLRQSTAAASASPPMSNEAASSAAISPPSSSLYVAALLGESPRPLTASTVSPRRAPPAAPQR